MKFIKSLLLSTFLFPLASGGQSVADSVFISSIYHQALGNDDCYENLRYLCKQIGHRLAGSESAAKAIDWGENVLSGYKPDSVFRMPVEVPHWSRGSKEYAFYTNGSSNRNELKITALGGSIGTNGEITAEVVEVKSFEELEKLGESGVRGKIVFFNKAMDALLLNTGAAYGGAYPIRGEGAIRAARLGAVASIIRSLTLAEDDFPHTGAMHYNDSVPRIPAGALSSMSSRLLSNALKQDPTLKLTIHLSCEYYGRRMQANVIAEIKGTVFPDEYITVGGHLDSWDIGEGAHDDGAGIVQSIELIRILKALNYKPKHTIRAVLFINEEFGNDGGVAYAKQCHDNGLIHVAALESDAGGFSPQGFSCDVNDLQYQTILSWKPLLEPYNLLVFRRGGSGVDIRPLKDERVALIGLLVDGQKYFDYHHTDNDRFENVNKRELQLGAAAMTSLIYLIDQTGIPATDVPR